MRYLIAAILAPAPFATGCVDSCRSTTAQVTEKEEAGVDLNRTEAKKPRTTEEYFRDLPERIQGADRIDKYRVEGAKHVLVHVRQAHHLLPEVSYRFISRAHPEYTHVEIVEKVNMFADNVHEFQFNIFTIYVDLIRRYDLKFLYPEGLAHDWDLTKRRITDIMVDREDGDAVSDSERTIEALKGELDDDVGIRRRFPDTRQANEYKNFLRANIEGLELQRPDLERRVEVERQILYLYEALGAAGKLGIADIIQLRPIEERLRDVSEFPEALRSGEATDGREDFVLQKLAEYGDPIFLVQFGGEHAWGGEESCGQSYSLGEERMSSKDNIAEWNRQNSDRKFALIEITPEGYRQIVELADKEMIGH